MKFGLHNGMEVMRRFIF